MPSSPRKRIVVVTGATSGVGRACARAFAARGDDVAILARGEEALHATRRELQDYGVEAFAWSGDVSDAAAVDGFAEEVETTLGPIDVWVNNAMLGMLAPFDAMAPAEFERITAVTYLGTVNGTRAALRHMRTRDRGRIVQVGSALAYRGIPLQSAYCGAKHAIKGFTDSVRTELMHEGSGIGVAMVQLPAVNTPQFRMVKNVMPNKGQPVPPIFQPELPARAVLYAADHDRREIWVGWATTRTILGNRAAPWLVDRILARTGYSSQQTDEPQQPDAPNYLWEPLRGDHGCHGVFDDRAGASSPALALSLHRRRALVGAAFTLGGGAAAVASLARRTS